MRINGNLTLTVGGVILVPYRREHVPKYHEWMSKPELLGCAYFLFSFAHSKVEATASEPLSLEEEYANQESWHTECTFIILDHSKPDTAGTGTHGGAMIGDTNLFFNNNEDPHEAEIEIMIAEAAARGRGIGRTALEMMMHFAVTNLGVRKFVARIGDSNAASIHLFKTLGYREVSHSAAFKETTFQATAEALQADVTRANQGLITGVYDAK